MKEDERRRREEEKKKKREKEHPRSATRDRRDDFTQPGRAVEPCSMTASRRFCPNQQPPKQGEVRTVWPGTFPQRHPRPIIRSPRDAVRWWRSPLRKAESRPVRPTRMQRTGIDRDNKDVYLISEKLGRWTSYPWMCSLSGYVAGLDPWSATRPGYEPWSVFRGHPRGTGK